MIICFVTLHMLETAEGRPADLRGGIG